MVKECFHLRRASHPMVWGLTRWDSSFTAVCRGPVLLEKKPICRNLLDLEQSPKSEVDNWYDDAPEARGCL